MSDSTESVVSHIFQIGLFLRKAGQLLSCSWCQYWHQRVNFSTQTLILDTIVSCSSLGYLLKGCRVCFSFLLIRHLLILTRNRETSCGTLLQACQMLM